MSGISLVLSAAKDALITSQYAIDVVSHNVTNVNTPGYSRQSPIISAKDPATYAGLVMGRGVEMEEIVRNTDSFIETRLRERNADLASMSEKEVYFSALEGIFNESSDLSLSAQFADFWNAWNDLSNNPSGNAERNALYEMGSLLTQSFRNLSGDLDQFKREINLALEAGVEKVNQITTEIASLNQEIVAQEAAGNANDLRDKRNALLSELSEYLDIKSFEYDNGTITVMTSGGYSLVDKAASYTLSMDAGNIMWEGSGGMLVNMSDRISGGKLCGWLDMRNEVIPKYEADLSELAKATIFEVNKIHSQGVGLEVFQAGQSLMGTYTVDPDGDPTATPPIPANSLATLSYGDKIDFDNGSFTLWIGDAEGANLVAVPIDLSTSGLNGDSTLEDLADYLSAQIGGGVNVTVSDNALFLAADDSHSFAFSDDTSNILSALGLNTFFDGQDALTMRMNTLLEINREYMAAGKIDSTTGSFAVGDNTNALAMAELQYESVTVERWTYERGEDPTSQSVNDTLENYLHSFVGSIGTESQSVTRSKEYNQAILDQLNAVRDSVSAVSLDEEMTELIKYQQGYAAAAKLISVADEMFEAVLETK